MKSITKFQIVILCGGLASRLGTLTKKIPKSIIATVAAIATVKCLKLWSNNFSEASLFFNKKSPSLLNVKVLTIIDFNPTLILSPECLL